MDQRRDGISKGKHGRLINPSILKNILKSEKLSLTSCSDIRVVIPDKPTWPYSDSLKEGCDGNKVDTYAHDTKGEKSVPHLTTKPTALMGLTESSALRLFIDMSLPIIDCNGYFGSKVQSDIRTMLQNCLEELKSKYLFFKNSYILDAGSMAEKTKIIKPDELDFLIALPILCEEEYSSLSFSIGTCDLSASIQTPLLQEMYGFLSSVTSSTCRDPAFNSSSSFHPCYFLQCSLLMALKKNLSVEIELLDNEKHSPPDRRNGRPSTFHFAYKVKGYEKLTLSVDVSFCIPFHPSGLNKICFYNSQNASRLKLMQERCVDLNTIVCVVVHMSCINKICADSFHFLADITKFVENEQARQCYMTAKYVAKLFLPQKMKNGCSICSQSIIPSYILKVIIFYMIDHHKDQVKWENTDFEDRVIEVFEILLHSDFVLKDFACYSWKRVFVDNIQIKKEVYIKVPGIGEVIHALNDETLNDKVSKYWAYMDDDSCNLTGLIEHLISFLRYLREKRTNGAEEKSMA